VNTSVLCCGVSTCGNWLWAETLEVFTLHSSSYGDSCILHTEPLYTCFWQSWNFFLIASRWWTLLCFVAVLVYVAQGLSVLSQSFRAHVVTFFFGLHLVLISYFVKFKCENRFSRFFTRLAALTRSLRWYRQMGVIVVLLCIVLQG